MRDIMNLLEDLHDPDTSRGMGVVDPMTREVRPEGDAKWRLQGDEAEALANEWADIIEKLKDPSIQGEERHALELQRKDVLYKVKHKGVANWLGTLGRVLAQRGVGNNSALKAAAGTRDKGEFHTPMPLGGDNDDLLAKSRGYTRPEN